MTIHAKSGIRAMNVENITEAHKIARARCAFPWNSLRYANMVEVQPDILIKIDISQVELVFHNL